MFKGKVVEFLVSRSNTCNLHKMDSPEPEYKTIEQCYPKLVSCLQQSPNDVVNQLVPLGILAQEDINFLGNPHHEKIEKAQRIVYIAMTQIKNDSDKFQEFVKALKAAGSWTRSVVLELEKKYLANKSLGNHENSSSQTQTTLTPLQSHGK